MNGRAITEVDAVELVEHHGRQRLDHQLEADRARDRPGDVGHADQLGRPRRENLDRQRARPSADDQPLDQGPVLLVQAGDHEPDVAPPRRELGGGPEHDGQVARHFLGPRARQHRDDRPAPRPLRLRGTPASSGRSASSSK